MLIALLASAICVLAACSPLANADRGSDLIASPLPSPSASRAQATAQPSPPVETPTPTPSEPPAPPAPQPPLPSPADRPCEGPALVSVWAHQDDDLIFANPAIADAVASGECVRTLYLTAGDAGQGTSYSRSRELGILRSYNIMRGAKAFWDEQRVTLNSGVDLTMFNPQGDPRVTVGFLRLPDGGLNAAGFKATGDTSIPHLLDGSLASLSPIDGGHPVTSASLQASVAEVIRAWDADRLFTHIPAAATDLAAGDHPDHMATGTITRAAWQEIGLPVDAVRYFVGYGSQNYPVNVSGPALDKKIEIYRIYAKEDPVIACEDAKKCLERRGFGAWLQRSYPKTDAELGLG